jgi:integrase/recombinase XerC
MDDECSFLRVLREKLAERDFAEGTRQRLLMDTRQFCEWYRGTYGETPNPDDLALNNADLNDYKGFLLRRCQANTTERKLASLRATLKLVAIDVLARLRFPRVPQSPKPAPSGFSRKERLAIFRAADRLSVRDRAIVYLAMWTGARSSSIADAKLSNVEVKARSGSITYDSVKGKHSSYTVPLNAEARDALAAWIGVRPPVQHDFVFVSEKYPFERLSRWALHSIWHRKLARFVPAELRAKLRGLHQCRHSLARMLVAEMGVNLPDVMQIFNWSSPSSVMSYTRASEADLRKHLDRAVGEAGRSETTGVESHEPGTPPMRCTPISEPWGARRSDSRGRGLRGRSNPGRTPSYMSLHHRPSHSLALPEPA